MTPVQITEHSRLSDERLRKILAGLHPEDTYAGFPRKTSIYNSDLRALVTEVLAAREAKRLDLDGVVSRILSLTYAGGGSVRAWVGDGTSNPERLCRFIVEAALKETTNAA